jgi:hypothetical protein
MGWNHTATSPSPVYARLKPRHLVGTRVGEPDAVSSRRARTRRMAPPRAAHDLDGRRSGPGRKPPPRAAHDLDGRRSGPGRKPPPRAAHDQSAAPHLPPSAPPKTTRRRRTRSGTPSGHGFEENMANREEEPKYTADLFGDIGDFSSRATLNGRKLREGK